MKRLESFPCPGTCSKIKGISPELLCIAAAQSHPGEQRGWGRSIISTDFNVMAPPRGRAGLHLHRDRGVPGIPFLRIIMC